MISEVLEKDIKRGKRINEFDVPRSCVKDLQLLKLEMSAFRRERTVAVRDPLTDLSVDAVYQDIAFLVSGNGSGCQLCCGLSWMQ